MPAGKTPKRGVSTRKKTSGTDGPSKATIRSPPRKNDVIYSPLTPGWTRAHGDMFTPVVALSPIDMTNTPSPFKNRRMTRRSSVYVTSTKVKKSTVTSPKKFLSAQTNDFKKPAMKSRQSAAPKPQTVRSPAITRARRSSVYVSAQTKSSMVIQEASSEVEITPPKRRKTPMKASRQTVKETRRQSRSRSRSKSPTKSIRKSRSKSRSQSPQKKTPVRVTTPLQARRALRDSTRKASTNSRIQASKESSPEKGETVLKASFKVSPKASKPEKILKVTLKTPPKEIESKEQKHRNTPSTATSRRTTAHTGLKKVTLQSPQLKSPRVLRIKSPGTPAKAAKVLGKVTITTPSRTAQQTKKQDTPLTSTPVKSTKKRRADGPPPVSEIRQTKLLRQADQNESVFPAPEINISINGVEVTDIKQVTTERMDMSTAEISKLEDEEDDGWLQWCTIL